MSIGSLMHCITWWHFQWPWWTLTQCSRSRPFWSLISWKQRILKTKLLLHKMKLYLTYGMVVCLMTLSDLELRHAGLWASAEPLVTFTEAVDSIHLRVSVSLLSLCDISVLAFRALMPLDRWWEGCLECRVMCWRWWQEGCLECRVVVWWRWW